MARQCSDSRNRSAPEKRRFIQPVSVHHEIERIRRATRPLGAGRVDGHLEEEALVEFTTLARPT